MSGKHLSDGRWSCRARRRPRPREDPLDHASGHVDPPSARLFEGSTTWEASWLGRADRRGAGGGRGCGPFVYVRSHGVAASSRAAGLAGSRVYGECCGDSIVGRPEILDASGARASGSRSLSWSLIVLIFTYERLVCPRGVERAELFLFCWRLSVPVWAPGGNPPRAGQRTGVRWRPRRAGTVRRRKFLDLDEPSAGRSNLDRTAELGWLASILGAPGALLEWLMVQARSVATSMRCCDIRSPGVDRRRPAAAALSQLRKETPRHVPGVHASAVKAPSASAQTNLLRNMSWRRSYLFEPGAGR